MGVLTLPCLDVPFDAARLDALMDEAGLDALIVTSKHNVQYLLGGFRSFFFEYIDAFATSRYLPVVVYQKRRPENAAYFGSRLESFQSEQDPFWVPHVETAFWTSVDCMPAVAAHVRRLGPGVARIGVELSFLPVDSWSILAAALGDCGLSDCQFVLETLRARKTPEELALLRDASERVVDAMVATFRQARPGQTKRDLADALRREEQSRGLGFDYCLVNAGADLNRFPSGQAIARGDILGLDSGGNYRGYIGDLCRMAVLGEPDGELVDLLAEVEAVQQAARAPLRAGACGADVYGAARQALERSPHRAQIDFLAHGMGLVSHEAPQLTSSGFVPYPGHHERRPLEAGMVLSIETGLRHARRGFIKLEDTVAVTAEGCVGFGDGARGWTRAGAGD